MDNQETPKRRLSQDVYPPNISLEGAIHGLFWVCFLGAAVGLGFKIWG